MNCQPYRKGLVESLSISRLEHSGSNLVVVCDISPKVAGTSLSYYYRRYEELAKQLHTSELVELLTGLHSGFDDLCEEFEVFKVETESSTYAVASWSDDRENHCRTLVQLGLAMIRHSRNYTNSVTEDVLEIQIGINSGPSSAGVISTKLPRKMIGPSEPRRCSFCHARVPDLTQWVADYRFFGDAIIIAKQMERNSFPSTITISADTMAVVQKAFPCASLGVRVVGSNGPMELFVVKDRLCPWEDAVASSASFSNFVAFTEGAQPQGEANLAYSRRKLSRSQSHDSDQLQAAARASPSPTANQPSPASSSLPTPVSQALAASPTPASPRRAAPHVALKLCDGSQQLANAHTAESTAVACRTSSNASKETDPVATRPPQRPWIPFSCPALLPCHSSGVRLPSRSLPLPSLLRLPPSQPPFPPAPSPPYCAGRAPLRRRALCLFNVVVRGDAGAVCRLRAGAGAVGGGVNARWADAPAGGDDSPWRGCRDASAG